jgi:hypothetical protein
MVHLRRYIRLGTIAWRSTSKLYIYTYHPEYHLGGLLTGAPTIPAAYSAKGISYRLIITNTEDYFRLAINAGTPGGDDDYIGFLIIGNKG